MNAAPCAGVGIGLRRELAAALLHTERRVDWVEITPENYLAPGGRDVHTLARAVERFCVGAHGVSLNLGGPDPLDDALLAGLGRVLDQIGADVYTEHLCWSAAHGVSFHDLLPLPFTDEAIDHTAARARRVRAVLGRPLLLENISSYAVMPGSVLDEATFISRAIDASNAGLLLDVNNVYVNAINHDQDPAAALDALPLEATGRIHIAGHKRAHGILVDDHGAPVKDAVLALLERALLRTGDVPVLLEWDLNIPSLDRVLDEADRVRAAVARAAIARAALVKNDHGASP